MANAIATAFVEVVPDTRAFAALLQAQVTAAIRSVRVPPVLVPVGVAGGGAAVGALAAETQVLSGAQVGLGETAVATTAAERALQAQLRSGGVDLSLFAAETQAAALAQVELAEAAVIADAALTKTGKGSKAAAQGMLSAKNESNILRGSLIGLARVTPVAVFGLGLAGTAAIALGLGVKGAISSAAQFEQSLNVFQAVSGATAEQMREVSQAALDLGADMTLPATSAQDAADALTALTKAGLTVPEALAGVKGALQLGLAGDLSPAVAAEAIASVINAFELAGEEAPHIADLFAGLSSAAQGDIQDFINALQQSSSVAHQSGLSIEQLSGIFVELARSGLKGADMGTSVRTTLLRLIPTTKEAAAFNDALGIKLDRTRTIGQQLPEVIDAYKNALDKLLPTQRTMVETQLVGQDSVRAFDIIIRKGSGGLAEAQAAADKAGEANRLAAAKTKGLSGSWANLKNQAEKTGLSIGQKLNPPLKLFVDLSALAIKGGDDFFTTLGKLGSRDDKEEGPLAFGPTKGEVQDFVGGKLTDAKAAFGHFWSDISGAYIAAQKKANAAIVAAAKAGGAFGVDVPNIAAPALALGKRDTTFSREVTAAEQAARDRVDAVTQTTNAIKEEISKSRARINFAIEQARAAGNLPQFVSAVKELIRRDTFELHKLEVALASGLGDVKKIRAKMKELFTERSQAMNDILSLFDPSLNPVLGAIEIAGIQANATKTLTDNIQNDRDNVNALTKLLNDGIRDGSLTGEALHEARVKVENAKTQLANDEQAAAAKSKTDASSAKSDAKTAADAAQHALDVQEENLRFFADSADNQGKNEKKLLAFLLERVNDAKGNQELFNKARIDYRNELEKFSDAVQDSLSASLDLQGARLDTRLAAALQTTPLDDEKRIYNSQIALLNIKIANQLALAKKAGFATKKGRVALLAIEGFKKEIIGIHAALKGLTDSSGFSLSDLFNEAISQFNEFASNVSSAAGPFTSAGAAQAFSGAVLAQAPSKDGLWGNIVAANTGAVVSEQSKTNGLLEGILKAVTVSSGTQLTRAEAFADERIGPAGFATTVHQRKLAKVTKASP